MTKLKLKSKIKSIKDFPNKGVVFKDITPLFNDYECFDYIVKELSKFVKKNKATVIASPEARGFLLGPVVAFNCNLPFVPVRKPNKLPREVFKQSYDLEYGSNVLEIHKDSFKRNSKVIIIDDLLATGGTINAIEKLVKMSNSKTVGAAFLIELKDLKGKSKIETKNIFKILEY